MFLNQDPHPYAGGLLKQSGHTSATWGLLVLHWSLIKEDCGFLLREVEAARMVLGAQTGSPIPQHPALPWHEHLGPCWAVPTATPSCRARPLCPKTWPLGIVVTSPQPSSAGCEFSCGKATVVSGETEPVAPSGGDQMSWPDVAVAPGSAGLRGGLAGTPPRRPEPPVPPAQMAHLEIPPRRRRMGDAGREICCNQQKTKPLASHATGDKRERERERPRGGPSGTMAILQGARGQAPDKGARCPQTPAAASPQNKGAQIWLLSSKSS